MRFLTVVARVIVILLIFFVSGCSNVAPTPEVMSAGGLGQKDDEIFDPNNFDHPTNIDNKWFPLNPGTQFVYEGETIEDGEKVPHKIVITVTDLTKVIGGIRSVATWDRDYSADELVEAELAFFAQDNNGIVWRMGEYPEEYDNGEFVEAPSWIHGFQDAKAGIAMEGNPQLNTPSYAEGWGPAVDWSDRGQVDQMGLKNCVPLKCYEDVMVIAESSASEPGAFQLKYYAANVGNIRTGWKGTDESQETLTLTELIQLDPEALSEARMEAIKLESHAYVVSRDMYILTSPAEYPVGTPALTIPIAVDIPETNKPSGPFDEEVLVYASDLPKSALSELDFIEDSASPDGKMIGLPNNGDELDPPPENDPHAIFTAQVKSGMPYRCWIHMKVGTPKGKSQANVIWVQFSGAIDQNNVEVFKPGSPSYMTAQGPQQEGWVWVGCEKEGTDSLVNFKTEGEITVRLQAGMEGVGFDQFVLSPTDFLEEAPRETIIEK